MLLAPTIQQPMLLASQKHVVRADHGKRTVQFSNDFYIAHLFVSQNAFFFFNIKKFLPFWRCFVAYQFVFHNLNCSLWIVDHGCFKSVFVFFSSSKSICDAFFTCFNAKNYSRFPSKSIVRVACWVNDNIFPSFFIDLVPQFNEPNKQ